ncbi:alkene reductase [Pelatocladus sp. BLCC-F211]|uniref:alkene reductase n=1 Tax=Pelatocladus sp. BLCC-F211 TaxID=3342752 RepID=UPI0035B7A307
MTPNINLFSPVQLGPYTLLNRIVMAPLTRNRAGIRNTPGLLNATYYEQRVSAGLIVTEATQVSPQGVGYPNTPGIHSQEQIACWRLVTDAIHARGGHIFLQLWHAGRISHPSLQLEGELPVAPSAIAPKGEIMTSEGLQPFVTPRSLEIEEISGIVEQFRLAAKNAMDAGFDGVEIHSATGYLLDQFIQDNSNQRTDKYGGSIENRVRLLLEVTEAVTSIWDRDRTGIRLSPNSTYNDMYDSDPVATFSYIARALNDLDVAYLHIVEPIVENDVPFYDNESGLRVSSFRKIFKGTLISGGGYDRAKGDAILAKGDADLISYGRLFIANPDLPERFAKNARLNKPDPSTFYGGGEVGYIDYPSLEEVLSI